MKVNNNFMLAAAALLVAVTILLNVLMIRQNNREQGLLNSASSANLNMESYKFDASPEDSMLNGTDVIVYLAQFGLHSTYGEQNITGASKLKKSLDTLYAHYLNDFPCDVIVFFGADNEPDPVLFKRLQTGRPRLYFRQLNGKYWELPHGLRAEDKWRWTLPGYSIGYRHMIRWYAYLIWPYLTSLGYTHVMRMDDDSYIHSSIKYNMFDYMRQNNKRYGFRQPCTDSTGEADLRVVVLNYIRKDESLVSQDKLNDYYRLTELGFYNNWFIADMSFFLEPPVSTLLQVIDESKIMYESRSNDLLIQSVLVRLFLEPAQVKWFDDFTYEHITDHGKNRPRNAGCPSFGGLSFGFGHDLNEWEALSKAFIDRYPPYCNIYNTSFGYGPSSMYRCLGSSQVCECELPSGPCGYYMKKLKPQQQKKKQEVKVLQLQEYKYNPTSPEDSMLNGTDVIVYLAQFGLHSTYGEQTITGASKLKKSLDTLYANYLNDFPCDVIVFFGADNEPDPVLFKRLQTGRPRLYFRQLNGKYWELPHGLRAEDKWRWTLPGYSIGYRHMIRWYAYLIWPYLTSLGYTHVMRMDDDSYIHSSIKYNMFDYMRQNNKRYGFRQPCMDSTGEEALTKVILSHLENDPTSVPREQLDDFNKLRYLGFYNNWFIADMSFFLEPPVSTLLQIIDESKIMYESRSNDLLIQSVLVRLFLEPAQVKWFDDFTYEHITDHGKNRPRNAGCPSFGGLSFGFGHDANEWEALSKAFIDRYPPYCNIYNTSFGYGPSSMYRCLGSSQVCECELLSGPCGYYMKKLKPGI